MIRIRPLRPTWGAVGAATMVLLAACGSDDSASEGTRSSSATQQPTTGVSAPPPTSAAPESTTPAATAAPATTAAPEPTTREVPIEDWATDVVTVSDQLAAAQVENAVEFVEWLPDDNETEPMYEKQVDAYLVLIIADAADVATAIDQMPESRSGDTDLAEPYEAFIDALSAEAGGTADLAERIEENLDVYRQEAVEEQVVPPLAGGPVEGSFNEVRADFANLQDEVTAACFALQAALTERNLALINCTGS